MNETNVYIGDYKALKISFPQKETNAKWCYLSGDNDKNISAFEVFLVHS